MTPAPRPDRGGSRDSAYAAELERGVSRRRFSHELEAEYAAAHLFNSRGLIRVACLLAATFAILRGVENVLRDAWSPLLLSHFGFVVAASIALAWIAWSPAFDRLYLPSARILVPTRNTIVAAHVGYVAAGGGVHELMILPLMLVGPFFFLGLSFRTALVTCALTVSTFLVLAGFFGMTPSVLFRTAVLLILAAAACAACACHLQRASRRRFLEGRVITELAEYDALTGTKNRRMFDEHLSRVWAQAIRSRCTIALLLIDVDHFKAYNDRYGHQAGDLALRRVAEALQRFVRRPLDILARYGGEEFAVILYGIDSHRAMATAEGMRRTVEGLGIEHADSHTAAVVTLSAGVAVIEPTAKRKPRGALQLADEALYTAKRNGRNRVELMGAPEYQTVITGVFEMAAHVRRDSSSRGT